MFLVKQNENWMRQGYPAAMGHNGPPITILKRGPSGTSQTDNQVKFFDAFIVFNSVFLMLFILINTKLFVFRLVQDLA